MKLKQPDSLVSAISVLMISALSLGLSGCGDSSTAPVGSNGSPVNVTGSVVAAPVSGANCEFRDSSGASISDSFVSDASGNYSVEVNGDALENDVQLVCTGGTYTDEADGTTQTAGTLSAFVASGTLDRLGGASVHATPGSTIINRLRTAHGMTHANARSAFENAFGFAPDITVAPTDATAPDSSASDDQKLAGLRAAIFSQLTADLGLTAGQQFDLLDALAQDLSDDNLDGEDGSGAVVISGTSDGLPADIQNRIGNALINFRAGNDGTGLTPDKIGAMPFGKVAMTTSYKVEFLPGAMPARQGKGQFQVRVSDRTTNLPVSGETVSLMPMMYMVDRTHSTPVIGCTESATTGTYDCTLYYLMPSQMMTGDSMGYWEVKVRIGGMTGEAADFYPPVMMAMGDTERAVLKSSGDQVMSMLTQSMQPRNYFLFKSDLSGMTGNHSFEVFLTTMETMMAFPAIYPGVTLNGTQTINTVSVRMSTDGSNWVDAASSGNGYYSATGLSGLTDGTQGTIYVELTINGVQYTNTLDGAAPSGTDSDYSMFTVTPGAGMNMQM